MKREQNLNSNKKTVILKASEMLEYKGYLKLIAESKTAIEVNTYHQKAMNILYKAMDRNKK